MFILTTKALNQHPNQSTCQICHSGAGGAETAEESDTEEDGFLAVKWFLDGELLKEITLAPEVGFLNIHCLSHTMFQPNVG